MNEAVDEERMGFQQSDDVVRARLKFFEIARAPALFLLPIATASFMVALRFPETTDSLYSQTFYPLVVRCFATLNPLPFSVAEPMLLAIAVAALLLLFRSMRQREGRWRGAIGAIWVMTGVLVSLFLILWGFNYARPSLGDRLELSARDSDVDAEAVLEAGRRTARITAEIYETLDPRTSPTKLPLEFDELNESLDEAYRRLELPGDSIRFRPAPAKRLWSSTVFSYLGISGIFVPFTGEPSVNGLQPDAALPVVVAHEKAHQRGVTHEGEANFAAFLACSRSDSPAYFRYAAYLFATRYLIGEASFYMPRGEIEAAWSLLGDGPQEDVRTIREFWERYEGPASAAAATVNDRYLRTMQVPEGVQSYGTVVELLVALDRRGRLVPGE